MLNEGEFKDKYLVHEGKGFRPYVQVCGEEPRRLELQDSIHLAQTLLSRYPSVCWDDYLSRLDWRRYCNRERKKNRERSVQVIAEHG